MAIDNGYDGEVVDGATNFQKKERDDVDGVKQSRDNPNPVTYPLNCVALSWWEPFSKHTEYQLLPVARYTPQNMRKQCTELRQH